MYILENKKTLSKPFSCMYCNRKGKYNNVLYIIFKKYRFLEINFYHLIINSLKKIVLLHFVMPIMLFSFIIGLLFNLIIFVIFL
jgi:hypothetical protein